MLVIAVSLFVLILLAGIIYGVQKKNLNDLNGDIGRYTKQLKDTPDLNKILTVQNQLGSLTALHNKKAVATRLFSYLTQVTPTAASISQLNVDFSQNTISITGSANSLDIVNTYADTLKFTKFKASGSSEEGKNAFTKVVLSQFSRTTSGATYTVTASFDPFIFDSASTINLDVPHIISTRSATEQPTDLFQTPGGQ
jgi:hypothetical protein